MSLMLSDMKMRGQNCWLLAGHVDCSGSDAPTGLTGAGVTSAARTGTGTYTVQMNTRAGGMDVVSAAGSTSVAGFTVHVTGVNLTTGVISVTVANGAGSAADLTGQLNFQLLIQAGKYLE